MIELGWVMQIFCDGRVLADHAPRLREIARDLPVVVDHYGTMDAARGVGEPNFQALLKLVGDGDAYVKVSAHTSFPSFIPIMPTRGRCTRRWSLPIRSG